MTAGSSSCLPRAACFLFLALGSSSSFSWSTCKERHRNVVASQALNVQAHLSNDSSSPLGATVHRRKLFHDMVIATINFAQLIHAPKALAYTPDSDPLRESLYLMSRVQEATVQQERFVNRATSQEALKIKMKLTLRLVEKNYRLLDQITFCSEYVAPDKVVDATTAGYESAEALQNAIDYVKELKSGPFEKGQKEYLTENLTECRERLFDFLSYMPQKKLEEARKRVEEGINA
jgi:hypothetical protein